MWDPRTASAKETMKAANSMLTVATLLLATACGVLSYRYLLERQASDLLRVRLLELERGKGNQVCDVAVSGLSVESLTSTELAAVKSQHSKAKAPPSSQIFSSWGDVADALKNPDYRAAVRAQQALSMRELYSDVSWWLGLSDDQVRALLDILVEHNLEEMKLRQPSDSGEEARQVWEANWQEMNARHEADIQALLGPDRTMQWLRYQQSGSSRALLRQLNSVLPPSEMLSKQQVRSVAETLTNLDRAERLNQRAGPSEAGSSQAQPFDQSADAEQSVEQARDLMNRQRAAIASQLTTTQLKFFDDLLAQNEEQSRVTLQIQRAMEAVKKARKQDTN